MIQEIETVTRQEALPELPTAGFLRVNQIVNRPAKDGQPAQAGIIPVCKATWFAGVRTGRFPQPTRELGPNITAWAVDDLRAFIRAARTPANGGGQ